MANRKTKELMNREIMASFSKREMEVVRCLVQGKKDKEISSYLDISERTVQTYILNSFKKLGVSNRTEAAIKAFNSEGDNCSGR